MFYVLVVGLAAASFAVCLMRYEEGGEAPAEPPQGLTAAEEAYGRAYAETLAVGEVEPDASGLDPERAAAIRRALEEAWRAKVRPIYRRRRS